MVSIEDGLVIELRIVELEVPDEVRDGVFELFSETPLGADLLLVPLCLGVSRSRM